MKWPSHGVNTIKNKNFTTVWNSHRCDFSHVNTPSVIKGGICGIKIEVTLVIMFNTCPKRASTCTWTTSTYSQQYQYITREKDQDLLIRGLSWSFIIQISLENLYMDIGNILLKFNKIIWGNSEGEISSLAHAIKGFFLQTSSLEKLHWRPQIVGHLPTSESACCCCVCFSNISSSTVIGCISEAACSWQLSSALMTITSVFVLLQDSAVVLRLFSVVSSEFEMLSFPSSSFCLFVSGLEDLELLWDLPWSCHV